MTHLDIQSYFPLTIASLTSIEVSISSVQIMVEYNENLILSSFCCNLDTRKMTKSADKNDVFRHSNSIFFNQHCRIHSTWKDPSQQLFTGGQFSQLINFFLFMSESRQAKSPKNVFNNYRPRFQTDNSPELQA